MELASFYRDDNWRIESIQCRPVLLCLKTCLCLPLFVHTWVGTCIAACLQQHGLIGRQAGHILCICTSSYRPLSFIICHAYGTYRISWSPGTYYWCCWPLMDGSRVVCLMKTLLFLQASYMTSIARPHIYKCDLCPFTYHLRTAQGIYCIQDSTKDLGLIFGKWTNSLNNSK